MKKATSKGAVGEHAVIGTGPSREPGAAPGTGGRIAAFFDLDKTIIAGSSSLAFGGTLYRNGMIDRRFLVRSAFARCVYRFLGADQAKMERMRSELSRLVTGWDAGKLRALITDAVEPTIGPMVYAEAADLIAGHRAAGNDIIIVSSSGTDVVEPVAELLGIDDVIATRMALDAGGRYTGEILFYAYGLAKAEQMRVLAAERGYDLAHSFAYSDSITDYPMLEAVGRPHVVNPDRELRSVARQHDWPVLDFVRPATRRPSNTADPDPIQTTSMPRAGRVGMVVAGLAATFATALLWVRKNGSNRTREKQGKNLVRTLPSSRVASVEREYVERRKD